MYIHKIVIDANCINARGGLKAMTELEEYHNVGVIEILQTSTLKKEFSKVLFFKNKADKYQTISGSSYVGSLDDRHPEALAGGVIGNSMFGLFSKLFPNKKSGKDLHNSIRDSLHIEQAILNYCDYFVTNEKALLKGGKEIPEIRDHINVVDPCECLEEINAYFQKCCNSSEPSFLGDELKRSGPIILGSNSCYGFSAFEDRTKNHILSAYVESGKLMVDADFYDSTGKKELKISPGKTSFTTGSDLSINCGGRGRMVIGKSEINHFMIGDENQIKLAGRITHAGLAIFFIVNMNGAEPKNSISVSGESLILQGVNLGNKL